MALEVTRRQGGTSDGGRDVVPLRTMMDRLIENAFTPSFGLGWSPATAGFGWDIYEDEDAYHIFCYLPGVDPNALNVSIHDNVLVVSGETKRTAPEQWRPLVQELPFGQFQRQATLGTPVDSSKAQADYQNGIVTITLPKAETAKPKQIKVGVGGAAGAGR